MTNINNSVRSSPCERDSRDVFSKFSLTFNGEISVEPFLFPPTGVDAATDRPDFLPPRGVVPFGVPRGLAGERPIALGLEEGVPAFFLEEETRRVEGESTFVVS